MSNRRLALLSLSALVVFAGCKDPEDPGGASFTPPSSVSAADYRLVVTPSATQVQAGDEVTFVAELFGPDDENLTEQYDIRTELSPSLGVLFDGAGLYRFTFTDTYTYFATVEVQGATLVGAASVDVLAGGAESIDVELEVPIAEAGQEVGVTAKVTDAYGNSAEAQVTWSAESPATVSGGLVTSQQIGSFAVTGTLAGGASDSESLTVTAADPASLSISLSSYDVEKGDGVLVNIDVRDAFGNPSEVMPDLSASPLGASAWGSFVRFDNEGIFTVSADLPQWSLHAEDGPVLVDSSGPSIRVTTPSRGAEIPSANGPTVTVSGSVSDAWTGVVSVDINGQSASLAAGGLFTFQMTPEPGLNFIELVAVDGDGNASDHHQTFLWGEFNPMGAPQEDGILARLNEGAIDTIEDMAADLFDPQAIVSGLINQPLWTNSQQTCINIWPFGNQCVTWWSLNAGITSATLGNMVIDLDAQNGYLDFFASISPFSIGGGIWGQLFPSVSSLTVNINLGLAAGSNSAEIDSDVSLWVNATNDIQVGMANTSVNLPGFGLQIYGAGILGDVLNPVLGWLSPIFEALMEAVLPPVIESQVPGLIEGALADIDIAASIPLFGTQIDIEALPQDIDIDVNGMTIALESIASAPPGPNAPATIGSWRRSDYSVPTFPASPDFDLSMADNFINQLMHAVWQAGVLDLSMDSSELGLDLADLQDFLPLTEISFETAPLLPPVVGPAAGAGGLLELGIGDMMVNVYGDPGGTYGLMMQLAVTIEADADLSIDSNNEIQFGVGTPTVIMSFVTSDWPDLNGEVAENLMDAVVDLIAPMLTDMLGGIGGIPIPELPGFTLGAANIYRETAPAYYITAAGNLVIVP
jgi:plastocyanin